MISLELVPDWGMNTTRPLCVINYAQQRLCVMKASYVTHNRVCVYSMTHNDVGSNNTEIESEINDFLKEVFL